MRILVVEDEKRVARFIRKALTGEGFTVVLSGDGNEALDVLGLEAFDAVVLDVMLPGRDGLALTRRLREGLNAVPVLLLTAREFALLELLVRHPGRVFTRTQLCERVWDYHFDPGSNLVDVYVQRLRRKVDDAFPVKLIHTIRGTGYKVAEEP